MSTVVVEYLADRPSLLPTVQAWFESQWPDYYGSSGRGNARADVLAYSNRDRVPLGLLAFRDDKPCGIVALRSEPFATHPHLGPWVGAAYVRPEWRDQGIGATLFQAIEEEARRLHYPRIYCATSTADNLLRRANWELLEQVVHDGNRVSIYRKTLS